MATQVRASHPAGIVDVGEGALDELTTPALQPLPSDAADATAIPVGGPLGRGRLRPVASTAIGFRDVRAQVQGRQVRIVSLLW